MSLDKTVVAHNAAVYTDMRGLASLRNMQEQDPQGTLRQAAQQFEAFFVQMLLTNMRSAKLADGLLDSKGTEFYQELYDKQIALSMSTSRPDGQSSGLGLADMLMRQLGGDLSLNGAHEKAAPSALQTDLIRGSETRADAKTDGLKMYQAALPEPDPGQVHAISQRSARALAGHRPDQAGSTPPLTQNVPQAATSVELHAMLAGATQRNAEGNTEDTIGAGLSQHVVGKDTDRIDPAQSPNKTRRFESPREFITQLWGEAREAAASLGVSPQVLLAQAALESGWGRAIPRMATGESSYNLFGIKAGRSWSGASVVHATHEFENGAMQARKDAFRAYDSYADSFNDYVKLLRNSKRYEPVVSGTGDPAEFYRGLQKAGYATDPNYANKLIGLLESPTMRSALHSRPSTSG